MPRLKDIIWGLQTGSLQSVSGPRRCVSRICRAPTVKGERYCADCLVRIEITEKARLRLRQCALADEDPIPEKLDRQTWIYFIGAANNPWPIKIGIADDVITRLRQLQTGSPCVLKVYGKVWCESCWEGWLHGMFDEHRLHGEWFRRNDDLEHLVKLAATDDSDGFKGFLMNYQRDMEKRLSR